jgi:hypothetical protein
MKKIFAVVALTAFAATAAYASQLPQTGINGSMHDINSMTASYTPDTFLRSCVFCHTPHNAAPNPAGTEAPLWNHAANVGSYVGAAYTWIAPANVAAGVNFAPDPLIGPSRLCMSCHDGQTAVDSHGSAGFSAAGGTVMSSGYADPILGGTAKRYISDLSVTHPIGFQYDAIQAARPGEIVASTESFINAASTALTGVGASTFDTKNRVNLTGGKTIASTLYAGFMTCASCHEVHNTTNAKSDMGKTYNYFLQAREEGSAICLSCHIK